MSRFAIGYIATTSAYSWGQGFWPFPVNKIMLWKFTLILSKTVSYVSEIKLWEWRVHIIMINVYTCHEEIRSSITKVHECKQHTFIPIISGNCSYVWWMAHTTNCCEGGSLDTDETLSLWPRERRKGQRLVLRQLWTGGVQCAGDRGHCPPLNAWRLRLQFIIFHSPISTGWEMAQLPVRVSATTRS